jgi:hypothetical protein
MGLKPIATKITFAISKDYFLIILAFEKITLTFVL